MAVVIDREGRLFGRLNIIDALMLGVLVLLVPLGFVSYLVFRTPPAKLQSIQPMAITQGPGQHLAIFAENLRPFMRISLNDVQALTFKITSPRGAEIDLPDLRPGTYDVVLYDYSQEVDRLRGALTVRPAAPLPTLKLEVSGAFIGLDASALAGLKPGLQLPSEGEAQAEVLTVGAPRPALMRINAGPDVLRVPIEQRSELPATIRVRCYADVNGDGGIRCMMRTDQQPVLVAPHSVLPFRLSGTYVTFQIGEVFGDPNPTMADVRVRFFGGADELRRLSVGDIDSGVKGYAPPHAGRIVSVGAQQVSAADGGAAALFVPRGEGRLVDVVVKVPVEPTSNGWLYRDRAVKVGAPFVFETADYALQGRVLDIRVPNP
jgi:hypothetical protein